MLRVFFDFKNIVIISGAFTDVLFRHTFNLKYIEIHLYPFFLKGLACGGTCRRTGLGV